MKIRACCIHMDTVKKKFGEKILSSNITPTDWSKNKKIKRNWFYGHMHKTEEEINNNYGCYVRKLQAVIDRYPVVEHHAFILSVFVLIPGVCSFDKGFCQWRNEATEDQFDWLITEGETPSKGTGPTTGFGGSGNRGAS